MLQHGEGMCELRAWRESESLRGFCSNFLIQQIRALHDVPALGPLQEARHWALLSLVFIVLPPGNYTDFERSLRNDFRIQLVTLQNSTRLAWTHAASPGPAVQVI